MGNILRNPVSGNAILLIPRTGSHSLVIAAIDAWWPGMRLENGEQHPAVFIPLQENWDGSNQSTAIVVRNPVERFRSLCAHRPEMTVDEHLENLCYGPLPQGIFARHFRFEDGLDAAAEYLGLPVPLPQIDATDEADKPLLTAEQESRVREIYSDDVALWESLS
jgi:hypothetical protein